MPAPHTSKMCYLILMNRITLELGLRREGQSTPKTKGIIIIVNIWSKFKWFWWQEIPRSTHIYTHPLIHTPTRRGTWETTIPKGQNWPRVTITQIKLTYLSMLSTLMDCASDWYISAWLLHVTHRYRMKRNLWRVIFYCQSQSQKRNIFSHLL